MESVAGAPVVGEDLFGRERELAHIWRMLERGAHVLMTAPKRVGKTCLMREMECDPRNGWIVVYADVEACTEPGDIIAEILGEIVKKEEFKKSSGMKCPTCSARPPDGLTPFRSPYSRPKYAQQ